MMLSLLDRSRTRVGRPDAEGLTGSIDRAVQVERLGYERFWVAEHHAVPGIASGSPAVLLAAIGAATNRVRLGSGGVMLPNHQPIVVAEQFAMLEAMYPGRIDLGVGRTLGFTRPVREALRQGSADTYEADLAELIALMRGAGRVTVRPAIASPVPMALLATGRGLALAAQFGLPVVIGGPMLWRDDLTQVLDAYRTQFRPSEVADRPRVTISLDVLVADSDASARDLALPEAWAMARSRQTGEFAPLEPVEAIAAQPWPGQVRRRVEDSLAQAVTGSPARVRAALTTLARRSGAVELMASSSTFDRAALAQSDRLLRDVVDDLATVRQP